VGRGEHGFPWGDVYVDNSGGWGLTKLSLLLVCLLVSSPAWGMDLALTGAWTLSSGPGEVVAGSDLPSSYESTSGEMAAAVFNTTGVDDAWRVDISGTGASWPAALHLFAAAPGTVSGPARSRMAPAIRS